MVMTRMDGTEWLVQHLEAAVRLGACGGGAPLSTGQAPAGVLVGTAAAVRRSGDMRLCVTRVVTRNGVKGRWQSG
jgi:hypothetical protein